MSDTVSAWQEERARLVASNEALAAVNAKLREALERYGKHVGVCPYAAPVVMWFDGVKPACTCGLDAALAVVSADPPEPPKEPETAGGDRVAVARSKPRIEVVYDELAAGAHPFPALTDHEVRLALLIAYCLMEDYYGLTQSLAQETQEAIVEAHGQAMEP